jgi:thiol-disulfide isomerase/thioredoxin
MNTRKRVTAAILAIAIAAPIADFFWSKSMPQTTPSWLQWTSARATAGQSPLSSLTGANEWLNSKPLTPEALRGKIVLIDFWTYTCINWLRTAPYVRAWAQKYRDHGLVVIGVHSPEFAFEKDINNVRRAVKDLGIGYPIAVDSDHAVWRGFDNRSWPALYFIDAQGRVRHHHFGEGSYEESERFIQKLLAEAGAANIDRNLVAVEPRGFEVAADWATLKSPENYLGYVRTEHFASPGGVNRNQPKAYELPARLRPNEWALGGDWTVRGDAAVLNSSRGVLGTRFHARDVNLVMSPPAFATPVRFRVTIDGEPPGDAHGLDVDEQGYGTVTEQRLYQLIRRPGAVDERTVEVEFLNPGVETFALTFG